MLKYNNRFEKFLWVSIELPVICHSQPGQASLIYGDILDIYYRGGSKGRSTRRAPPPKIGKNMIFWRKIVIFHTKYPKNFRALLRSAQIFLSAPPPLTWNPESAPVLLGDSKKIRLKILESNTDIH